MSGRVIQCYLNSDLRCSHDGLAEVAKKDKIMVKSLEPGQYVVFINSKKDRMKVYASNNVLAYLRLEDGRRIDLNTVREIPRAFAASGRIDYDKALEKVVREGLEKKRALN